MSLEEQWRHTITVNLEGPTVTSYHHVEFRGAVSSCYHSQFKGTVTSYYYHSETKKGSDTVILSREVNLEAGGVTSCHHTVSLEEE